MSRCGRRGWSLIELLLAAALLSASLMFILGMLHNSFQATKVDGRSLLMERLLDNMVERYRLLSIDAIERRFGRDDGGAYLIDADPVLNHTGTLSSAQLRAMGLARSVHVIPWAGIRPTRLLCTISSTTQTLRRLVTVVDDRTVWQLPDTCLAVAAFIERADLEDGHADYRWPERIVSLEQLNRVLARRPLPDGPFSYRVRRFERSSSASIAVLRLSRSGMRDHFILREDFADCSFLGGMALRPPQLTEIVRLPSAKAPRDRLWGLMAMTESRVFVAMAATDRDGRPLATGQQLLVATVPQPFDEDAREAWQTGLAQTLQQLGSRPVTADGIVDEMVVRARLHW